MNIGSYKLVIEGDPVRVIEGIDTLEAPPEGRVMEIDHELYVVVNVRTVQDYEARSEQDKIHTYPRVWVRKLNGVPDAPPNPSEDKTGANVLKFTLVPRADDPTVLETDAETKAWKTHREQIMVEVRRLQSHEEPTILEQSADKRAAAAHREQMRSATRA